MFIIFKSWYITFSCREDDKCWLLPIILFLFKSIQARFVNWHIANLEIEDFSLFCPDPDAFWAHEPGLWQKRNRSIRNVNLDVKFLVNPTVQKDASFRRGTAALPVNIYSEMYRRMKYSSALFRFFVKKISRVSRYNSYTEDTSF